MAPTKSDAPMINGDGERSAGFHHEGRHVKNLHRLQQSLAHLQIPYSFLNNLIFIFIHS